MAAASNLDLLFERWKASLKEKDRSREFISGNFDELFDGLNSAGATFEQAHEYLQPAVKAHLPSPHVARNSWKNARNAPEFAGMTEKEYIDGWHKDIADKATNSFYHIFPIPEEQDSDGEPKVYGSMSAKEYKLQRRHAESYPILNTEELERRLQQISSGPYDPARDILGEDSDGESK